MTRELEEMRQWETIYGKRKTAVKGGCIVIFPAKSEIQTVFQILLMG